MVAIQWVPSKKCKGGEGLIVGREGYPSLIVTLYIVGIGIPDEGGTGGRFGGASLNVDRAVVEHSHDGGCDSRDDERHGQAGGMAGLFTGIFTTPRLNFTTSPCAKPGVG